MSMDFLQPETIVQKSARPSLKRWYNNRAIDQNIHECRIGLMHSTVSLKTHIFGKNTYMYIERLRF